jgi:3-phenylpropionate/trans-cinnamate dioxygenase ferredoxin subunit
MQGYEPLVRAEDLPLGTLLAARTSAGESVCLINDGGTIRAVAGHCSHQEFPLDDGTLLPGGRLECAWHGAQFDLTTGVPVHPPAEEPIAVYRVMVIGGMVCVGPRRT